MRKPLRWWLWTIIVAGILRAEQMPEPTLLSKEPILLDAVTVKAIVQRAKLYDIAADTFWDRTLGMKSVRYLDVIGSAYENAEFDLAATLAKKKAYRERTAARGHDFFCNYGAIHVAVPVAFEYTTNGAAQIQGGVHQFVRYHFKRRAIIIERQLYRPALMQASGLSLCGSPTPEALARIKQIGQAKKDFEFRRQVNFEVQLQDLNRLYALYSRHPIMDPLEALEALCMMGERPKVEQIEQALKRGGFAASRETIEMILKNTEQKEHVTEHSGSESAVITSDWANDDNSTMSTMPTLITVGGQTFSAAHRLVSGFYYKGDLIVEGLRRLRGDQYVKFLERILVQAPGHI